MTTYICLLHDLYFSEVGRFRVGVGLSGPMKVQNYLDFLQMQTENNGGHCTSKNVKQRHQGVLTKHQYVMSWE